MAKKILSPFAILPEDEAGVQYEEIPGEPPYPPPDLPPPPGGGDGEFGNDPLGDPIELPEDPNDGYGYNPPGDPVRLPEDEPLGTDPVPPGPVPMPDPEDAPLGNDLPGPPIPLAEPPVMPLPPPAGTPTGIPGTFGVGAGLGAGHRTSGFAMNRGGRVRPTQFGPGVPNVAPSGFESSDQAAGAALSDDDLLRAILRGKRGGR